MSEHPIRLFTEYLRAKQFAQTNGKLGIWSIVECKYPNKEKQNNIVTSIKSFQKTYLEQPRLRKDRLAELFNPEHPTKLYFYMEFDDMKYDWAGIVVENKAKEINNRLIDIFNKEYDLCLCFEDIIIREK